MSLDTIFKNKKSLSNKGFTLIELLIVVSLITGLTTVVIASTRIATQKAKSSKIASDFRILETAWSRWRLDSGHAYPTEAEYVALSGPKDTACPGGGADTINMSRTHLYTNAVLDGETPIWRGPYMSHILQSPVRTAYYYDNDAGAYIEGSSCPAGWNDGVNVALEWCPANDELSRLVTVIDKIVDGSIDRCQGKFRYSDQASNYGRVFYLIDATANP